MNWDDKRQRRAMTQGWGLYAAEHGLEIQRNDEKALFASDEEAVGFVKGRASMGCPMARLGLRITNITPQHEDKLTAAAGKTTKRSTAAMKKTYIIGVREVHVRHYSVQAENEEEAKDLVDGRGDEVVDLEFEEFANEMSRDTWSVEEIPEQKNPPRHNEEGEP